MNDERLKVLKLFQLLTLCHGQQLIDFQNRLAGLNSCFSLTGTGVGSSAGMPTLRVQTKHGVYWRCCFRFAQPDGR